MIQVISRVFDILEFLSSGESRDMSLAEISDYCGLQKTTCANILKSLQERGYVNHAGKMKGYRLGHKAFLLVGSPDYFRRMAEIAREDLELLFSKSSETVVFATENHDKRVILSTFERQQGITARIAHSTDLYRSSTGRIMLAFYPEAKTASIIDRIGLPDVAAWQEVSSCGLLMQKLASIREKGFCVTHSAGDIVGIAVPVFKNGEIISSVGICLPEYRFNDDRLTLIRNMLSECAQGIESKL